MWLTVFRTSEADAVVVVLGKLWLARPPAKIGWSKTKNIGNYMRICFLYATVLWDLPIWLIINLFMILRFCTEFIQVVKINNGEKTVKTGNLITVLEEKMERNISFNENSSRNSRSRCYPLFPVDAYLVWNSSGPAVSTPLCQYLLDQSHVLQQSSSNQQKQTAGAARPGLLNNTSECKHRKQISFWFVLLLICVSSWFSVLKVKQNTMWHQCNTITRHF